MASSSIVDKIFRMRAKDQRVGKKLDSHEFPENLKGKPLKIRQKNFTVPLAKQVQSYHGAPEYALRARKIEDAIEELMKELSLEYFNMLNEFSNKPEVFAQKWEGLIDSLELNELNSLIEKHNKYYPVEANLHIDRSSGNYLIGATIWKEKEKITKDKLIKRFPMI